MSAPEEDLAINCTAQLQLLEICRTVNPGIAIVHAGTRQIYGRPEYLPVDERHPLRPVDVNGVNKMAGEAYHLLFRDVYGVKTRSLRLTNVYGPGMRIKDARQNFLGIWLRRVIEFRRSPPPFASAGRNLSPAGYPARSGRGCRPHRLARETADTDRHRRRIA